MQKIKQEWSSRLILAGVFSAALLPFLSVELFHDRLYRVMDISQYLVFHNIAEFFSVVVSFSIFGVGWYAFDQSKDRHALFLSAAFLAIGLMDFMHTLGYAGMPAFITPNSGNKSTQFWIAVRLFAAVAFLGSSYVYPASQERWLSKTTLITVALAISGLVFTAIIFFPEYIPATFIEGMGLTPFKKVSEYVIICLLLLASAAYWKRMSRTGDRLLLYYLAAFVLCIFSELVFAIYKSVFDTYNVLGHVYKVAAFFLIYKGIFTVSVKNPYEKLVKMDEQLQQDITMRRWAEEALKIAKKEWEDTFDAITDPIFIHDSEFRILRANRAYQEAAGLQWSEIIGKPYYEVFPKMEAHFNGCLKALRLQEQQEEEVTDPLTCKTYKIWFYPIKTDAYKYLVHILEDITEKKKTENELKERLDELERFHRATVGREIVMHDVMEENERLRKRIEEMEGK